MKLRRHATIAVERAEGGKAPTAFRIWRAGTNVADDGEVIFTEESAKLLLAEQESRARVYAIDFDHLSLLNDRPAEAGRAAGWHRIEARDTEDGPELWAVGVEWCADVKAGLEEEPPRWRFFSPAFLTDDENEVTSYINLALCINPMTHGIPLLASRKLTKESTMTAEEMLSQLDAMIEATEDPDQKAALVAAREALAGKKGVDDDAPADAPVVADAAKSDGAVTHSEGDDGKKDDDKEKKSSTKMNAQKDPDPVAALTAQVVALQRKAEVGEINEMLSKHPHLPEEFKAHCRKHSVEDAKVLIATVVGVTKTHTQRKDKPSQGANAPQELDPLQADFLDRSMGIGANDAPMPKKDEYGRLVMHTVKPSQLARMNAQKAKV